MEIDVKEFYEEKEIVTTDDVVIKVRQCVVDNDVIRSYLKNNIVKFIFFDEKYSDISSDNSVHDIHKLKSKYRGNTYVRLPLRIVQPTDSKYNEKIVIDTTAETPDGFVIVSKRDLCEKNKTLLHKSKKIKEAVAHLKCENSVIEYNYILMGKLFQVKHINKDTDEVLNETLFAGDF
jgi:hypothetical protein